MNYFAGIKDLKEAKTRYRALAKKMHPDVGGEVSKFQEMKNEYALLLTRFKEDAERSAFTDVYDEILKEMKNLGMTSEQIKLIEKAAGSIFSTFLQNNPQAKEYANVLSKLLG